MKLNNRGATLLETLMAGSLGVIVIMTAMFTPWSALRQFFKYSTELNQSVMQLNVVVLLREDMMATNGEGSHDVDMITLGEHTYSFRNNGVMRNGTVISDIPLILSVYERGFTLSEAETSGNEYSFFIEWKGE